MNWTIKDRKGSARDIGLFVAVFFAIGLLSFVVYFAYQEVTDVIIVVPEVNASTAAVSAFTDIDDSLNKLDYLMLMLMLGFFIGVVITGYLVRGHPVYMVIYVIFVLIVCVAGGVISFVWGEITTASVFGTTINNFPMTNFIMENLVMYVVILGFLAVGIMYVGGERR